MYNLPVSIVSFLSEFEGVNAAGKRHGSLLSFSNENMFIYSFQIWFSFDLYLLSKLFPELGNQKDEEVLQFMHQHCSHWWKKCRTVERFNREIWWLVSDGKRIKLSLERGRKNGASFERSECANPAVGRCPPGYFSFIQEHITCKQENNCATSSVF